MCEMRECSEIGVLSLGVIYLLDARYFYYVIAGNVVTIVSGMSDSP